MENLLGSEGQGRLREYFDGIGDILANKCRRASFATYAMGLFGDGERKSVEPIAARACADPEKTDDVHQRLCHFLVDSHWDDRGVRRYAAEYGLAALLQRESIDAWIVDDTGMLKQGSHSVGVQRQYTGSAGKIANCQLAVSLSVATATEHLPIDIDLYLPESWIEDPKRRAEARIPEPIKFRTKIELAVELIDRAIEDDVPRAPVLADSFYGRASKFRNALRQRDLQYAVEVQERNQVILVDVQGRKRGSPMTVAKVAADIAARGGFRKTTWREGTKAALSARFALRRVIALADEDVPSDEREIIWLLMEWEQGEASPSKYYFANLPKNITKKRLVRLIKQRWRTERVYEDLKGELGFDHYEGRRYPGWQHHVSVALSCFAFIVAERTRLFSPSARGTQVDQPQQLAA